MFGDPVGNPKGLKTENLGEVVTFLSGGTPLKSNKSYWNGDFPWVSPKDMKVDFISNSQDHITEVAFAETNLKKIQSDSILMVVRGMILAHTVPFGITTREVAINQDMKALIPNDTDATAMYIFYCLKCMHNFILGKVSTAAHGTKRFEMDDIYNLSIPLANSRDQVKFGEIVSRHEENFGRLRASLSISENAFASLSKYAFS